MGAQFSEIMATVVIPNFWEQAMPCFNRVASAGGCSAEICWELPSELFWFLERQNCELVCSTAIENSSKFWLNKAAVELLNAMEEDGFTEVSLNSEGSVTDSPSQWHVKCWW